MPRKVGKRTSTKNGVGRPQKNKGVTAGLARPGGIADVIELSEVRATRCPQYHGAFHRDYDSTALDLVPRHSKLSV